MGASGSTSEHPPGSHPEEERDSLHVHLIPDHAVFRRRRPDARHPLCSVVAPPLGTGDRSMRPFKTRLFLLIAAALVAAVSALGAATGRATLTGRATTGRGRRTTALLGCLSNAWTAIGHFGPKYLPTTGETKPIYFRRLPACPRGGPGSRKTSRKVSLASSCCACCACFFCRCRKRASNSSAPGGCSM